MVTLLHSGWQVYIPSNDEALLFPSITLREDEFLATQLVLRSPLPCKHRRCSVRTGEPLDRG